MLDHLKANNRAWAARKIANDEGFFKRLEGRGRDTKAEVLRRFTEAQQEIRTAEASGVYDLLVVNEDNGVEKTVDAIRRAITRFRDGPATLF